MTDSSEGFSPLPAPGIHPRIFLSPEDLPELRAARQRLPRKAFYEALKKKVTEALDNPNTPEGKVMALIKEGKDPSDAQFAGLHGSAICWLLAGLTPRLPTIRPAVNYSARRSPHGAFMK